MRLPVFACALLAACGSDQPPGVTIEITPTDGVVTVELFVGNGVGRGPSGAPNAVAFPNAERYEVLGTQGPWLLTLGKDESFLLLNDEDRAKTQTIAAVGYDANGTAIAVFFVEDITIEPGMTARWRFELSPASDIVAGEVVPDGEFRVHRWLRPSEMEQTMPSCIQIVHNKVEYAFGPIGDRDCDEFMPAIGEECAPWIHLAEGVVPSGGIASAVCGTEVVLQPGYAAACVAGARTCDEVRGTTDPACHPLPTTFCVPNVLCNCPAWDPTCLQTKLALQPPVYFSYIKCHVCLDQADFPEFSLAPLLGASAATNSCANIRMRELGNTIGPFGNVATFPTSTLTIETKVDCSISAMKWMGTKRTAPDTAVVSLDLENGNHILVPLSVEYDLACTGVSQTCAVVPFAFDASRLCADPPAASTCGGDAICGFGPSCGDRCCGPGERCQNGVCLCGTNSACAGGEVCGASGPPPDDCGTMCCDAATGCP